jgi:PPOX class probable F420-dependent enzyme
MTVTIPVDYMDLLERPVVVSLATVNADGQPQVTPVWIDYDGEFLRVNSADGRKKVANMEARPQATVLWIDPNNPYRFMEVRGTVVSISAEGALEHINALSAKYRNQPDYYAGNEGMRGKEQRMMFRIRPDKVNVPAW